MVQLRRFLGSPIFEGKIILKMEETVLANRNIIVLAVKAALRVKKKTLVAASLARIALPLTRNVLVHLLS